MHIRFTYLWDTELLPPARMKIFILLPAYNEENSIPRLLPKIHSVLAEAVSDITS